MSILSKLFSRQKSTAVVEEESKEGKQKDVFIQTGSYSLDGGLTVRPGFPLTKTNIAHKPSKRKGEIACMQCGGDGWDANSGGGVFICPTCKGTGVEDGNATCTCGHKRYEHYLDSTCEHDYVDLYGSYYREDKRNPLIHGGEYDINKRPCKCDRFVATEVAAVAKRV